MLEKAIEEIVKRFTNDVWPDLPFRFVESQRRLPNGKIINLCFRNEITNELVILELKRNRVTTVAVDQIRGYLDELKTLEPNESFKGLVVGLAISEAAKHAAEDAGVAWRTVDEARLRTIAIDHGIPLDHDSGYRPKAPRSKTRASLPSRRGSRPPTPPETVAYLRGLDTKFPPGSLDHRAKISQINAYWRAARPQASADETRSAAAITQAALRFVRSAAVSNRSQSKSDPYTTIRLLDGRVAAAIDIRRGYIKLDFLLPEDVARRCVERGELTIWAPRGYSYWVQSRVGKALDLDRAIELLRIGLAHEFTSTGQ